MPRVKEAIDITPGTKTKDAEIGAVKGAKLENPIKFTATWVVPTVDELVELLSTDEGKTSLLTEIATARRDSAVSDARVKALSENEPRESKIARFVKMATEKFGLDVSAATAMAEANIK